MVSNVGGTRLHLRVGADRLLAPFDGVLSALLILLDEVGRAQLTAEVLAGVPSVGKPVNARRLLAALARAAGA